MASSVVLLLLVSAAALKTTVGEQCRAYNLHGVDVPAIDCWPLYCCGSCDARICCPFESKRISEVEQMLCVFQNGDVVPILILVAVIVAVVIIISCCVNCICRSRRSAGIATVVHTIPAHTGYQNLLSQPVAFGQQGPYSPGPAPSHQSIVTHGETMPPAYSPNYTQPAKPSY